MEQSRFNEIIETCNKMSEFIDKLYELKIDIINTPLFEYFNTMESICIKNEYGDEGYDWFSWFLYEKMSSKNPDEMKAWDADGNEICATAEDLYTFLEENYAKNLDNTKK